jgi:exonuclease III
MGQTLKCNLTDKLNINTYKKVVYFNTASNKANPFKIFHQNISGLKYKTNELFCSFGSDYPHVLCLTEHHMREHEIDTISIDHYNVCAKFCRKHKKNCGVSIFVRESVKFSNIYLEGNSTELDIELCAIKLNLLSVNVIIISIYRSPTGNFKHFLNKLENILNSLHRNKN